MRPIRAAPAPIIPGPLLNKPMFRIKGGTSHVRFKDLWLWSLSAGIVCWPRSDSARIAVENTNAIEMNNKDYSGDIKDVIFENVCIENFTYGIKAISNNGDRRRNIRHQD